MNELTREQILAMPAGRELDALVAENVFGYKMADHDRAVWCWTHYDELKRYSRDLYAAWEVVNKLMLDGYDLQFYCVPMGKNKLFDCIIFEETKTIDRAIMQSSIELAICKASLLAVMGL